MEMACAAYTGFFSSILTKDLWKGAIVVFTEFLGDFTESPWNSAWRGVREST